MLQAYGTSSERRRYRAVRLPRYQVSSIVSRDVIEYKGGRIKGMSRFNEELELGKTYRIRGLIFNGNNYEFGELYSTCEQSVIVELI